MNSKQITLNVYDVRKKINFILNSPLIAMNSFTFNTSSKTDHVSVSEYNLDTERNFVTI